MNTLPKLFATLLGLGATFIALPSSGAGAASEPSQGKNEPDQTELFDPTQPNWFGVNIKRKTQRSLILNSLVTGAKRRIAIINGELLREGDSYRGLRLTQILNDRVLLKNSAGKIITLKLERTKKALVRTKSKGEG